MSRVLIFLGVATLLWACVHYYLARRLFPTWRASGWRRRAVQVAFWSGVFLGPLTMVIARGMEGSPPLWLIWPLYLHMGFIFLLLAAVVFRDVGLLFARGGARLAKRPIDEGRRAFLTRTTNAGAVGLATLGTGIGVKQAIDAPDLVEVDVPIDGLPEALDGYRIAQISDVHVGPTIKKSFVDHVVARVNELDVDMVAVTGDLVDGSVQELLPHMQAFGGFECRDGVFFCTGNHEYYSGALEWIEAVRTFGWTPLVNEHRMIERNGAKLLIAGCTDYRAERVLPEHASDPIGAKADAAAHDVSVLLAHQPRSIHKAAEARYTLQLSGHTHGGQLFPASLFVGLAHPFSEGLGKQDDTWIYVNRGTGYWGPPLRLGVPSEITLLRLVRA